MHLMELLLHSQQTTISIVRFVPQRLTQADGLCKVMVKFRVMTHVTYGQHRGSGSHSNAVQDCVMVQPTTWMTSLVMQYHSSHVRDAHYATQANGGSECRSLRRTAQIQCVHLSTNKMAANKIQLVLLLIVCCAAQALAQCGGLREPPCSGNPVCTYVPPGGGRSAPNGNNVCVECGSIGRPLCLCTPPPSPAWHLCWLSAPV